MDQRLFLLTTCGVATVGAGVAQSREDLITIGAYLYERKEVLERLEHGVSSLIDDAQVNEESENENR
jgi:hypothetical protein